MSLACATLRQSFSYAFGLPFRDHESHGFTRLPQEELLVFRPFIEHYV